MKISELREILHEINIVEGDIDVYAFVTADSGYLIDCHNAVHRDPLVTTGKGYTLVCENVAESRTVAYENGLQAG